MKQKRLSYLIYITCMILGATGLAAEDLNLRKRTIDISPYRIPYYGFPVTNAQAGQSPMVFSTKQGLVMAWNDQNKNIHVSLLKGKNTLKPKDIYHKKGYRLENAIKVKGGLVLLTAKRFKKKYNNYYTHWELYLIKINLKGKVQFKTKVIGDPKMKKPGDKMYYQDQQAYVAFNGTNYAVLTTRLQIADDMIGHQSDRLTLYNKKGKLVKNEKALQGKFNWASHSFKPRIIANGKSFFYATSCDAWPERGLIVGAYPQFTYKTVIKSRGKKGDNDMYVHLGDMVRHKDGAMVIFDTDEKRKSFDLAMVAVGKKGKLGPIRYLKISDKYNERTARMKRYGKNYFITWVSHSKKKGKQNLFANQNEVKGYFAVVDKNGKFIQKPLRSDTFRSNVRLFKYPNGTVGWVDDTRVGTSKMYLYKTPKPGKKFLVASKNPQPKINWKKCAKNKGNCKPTGKSPVLVRFGKQGKWTTLVKPTGKSFKCDAKTFKNNPAPGQKDKKCQYAQGAWQKCAGEGGVCTLKGSYNQKILMRYGAGTTNKQWVYRKDIAGSSIPCNNSTFGDPAPYIVKSCYFMPLGGLPKPKNVQFK